MDSKSSVFGYLLNISYQSPNTKKRRTTKVAASALAYFTRNGNRTQYLRPDRPLSYPLEERSLFRAVIIKAATLTTPPHPTKLGEPWNRTLGSLHDLHMALR